MSNIFHVARPVEQKQETKYIHVKLFIGNKIVKLYAS